LFQSIAKSKELGLRTLRTAKGAVPAHFKSNPTCSAIVAALPEDSVYVEIFRRQRRRAGFAGLSWEDDDAEYIALPVRKDGYPVRLIVLGDAKLLDHAVKSLLGQLEAGPEVDGTIVDEVAYRLGAALRDTRYRFFAPDGVFQSFPFSMLSVPSWPQRRWSDERYRFLLEMIPPVATTILVESAARLLFSRQSDQVRPAATKPHVIVAPDCGGNGRPYANLPGAHQEAAYVAQALGTRPLVLPSNPLAKGVLLGALDFGADSIHLSGHADTFGKDAKARVRSWNLSWRQQESLLDRADPFEDVRLILGGFNDWVSDSSGKIDVNDVSMSAAELAATDLTAVRLFTLATCHGARGADRPLEAPASLATAIRMAGAGVVIASLWSVNDETTARLMYYLYRFWSDLESVSHALALAQEQLATDGVPPCDWAAFVVWADARDIAPHDRFRNRQPSARWIGCVDASNRRIWDIQRLLYWRPYGSSARPARWLSRLFRR
jgi:hypothetical protein